MLGFLFAVGSWGLLLTSPIWLALTAIQIWMLIHALRQRKWLWALFIFIGWGFVALWYYFKVYRLPSSPINGFELPVPPNRQSIESLEEQAHYINNAYNYLLLGDAYFQLGKFADAEQSYRTALKHDPRDVDVRAHLGHCLLRQKHPTEARTLLEDIAHANPKHDFGHTLMAYAETLEALGETEAAFNAWKRVNASYAYPRARVQLAEFYITKNQPQLARDLIKDVAREDRYAPSVQRQRDRLWVRRSKELMQKLD